MLSRRFFHRGLGSGCLAGFACSGSGNPWFHYGEGGRVEAGTGLIDIAMFDEMDEDAAIFKCSKDPPVGASELVTDEGLAADHYLRLSGLGKALMENGKPVRVEEVGHAAELHVGSRIGFGPAGGAGAAG